MANNLIIFGEKMKKILYVSKGLIEPLGGAETAAYKILKELLQSNQIRKLVILTTKPLDKIELTIKEFLLNNLNKSEKYFNKIHFYCIPLVKKRIPIITDYFDARRFASAITKIISFEEINIIHIHTYSSFYIVPRKGWGIPILYTFHDFPSQWPSKPYNYIPFNYIEKGWKFIGEKYWQLITAKSSFENYNLFFHCLSSDIKNYLLKKGIPKQKVRIITNGFEMVKGRGDHTTSSGFIKKIQKLFFEEKKKKLKILIVGQINNTKNQHTILDGFERFSEVFPDTILLIAGGPTPIIGTFYLRKIWKNLKPRTKRKILWFGHISNRHLLEALYNLADLGIIMSYSEASPLTLGEYKSFNIPIITSNVGSLKDLLPEECKGLNPNSPEILKVKLENIVLNDHILETYSEMIDSIQLLSWNEVSERMIEFYRYIQRTT